MYKKNKSVEKSSINSTLILVQSFTVRLCTCQNSHRGENVVLDVMRKVLFLIRSEQRLVSDMSVYGGTPF